MAKIAISEFVTQPAIDYLLNKGYEVIQGDVRSKGDMISLLHGCEGLLIRTTACDREVLEGANALKAIGKHGVGTDNIDVAYATEKGIQVTFTPEANSNSVAEHALFLIMACAKKGYPLDKYLRESGDFAFRTKYIGEELEGKTLGLVGLGRIGQRLGVKAALGLGMKVIGVDPFIKKENVAEEITFIESRDALLAQSDFVSLHLPVTPQTRGFMNLSEMQKMKSTACLINAARGELIVTADLVTALQNGTISSAGIDVFETEPPGSDCPLLGLDNIVLSPHTAGGTKQALDKMGLHAAMGIHEALTGEKITWPVNRL